MDMSDCWLHGTAEGREWLENRHEEVRYDALEQARNALYEARKTLKAWARLTHFRSNVDRHLPVESQTLHRMDEVISTFHRENDSHRAYEKATGRKLKPV